MNTHQNVVPQSCWQVGIHQPEGTLMENKAVGRIGEFLSALGWEG